MRGYHTTVPVTAEYAFDHLGRVTDVAAGTGVDFHYDYVANENNIWKKRFDHRNGSPYNEYGYDDIDRLTRADYLKGLTTEYEAFNLDDLGNRQSTTLRDGSGDTYAVDALTNRYDSIDSVGLDYDDAGNLTRDKDGYVYGYDYENRIVEIRSSADAVIAQMDYDTQGRRIRVYDAVAGTTTLYYYSDNWQVLQEHNGTAFTAYYVYGNYIDEVLLMNRLGTDVFYLHDHLYSPVALLNSAGTVVERYEYNAYGKVTVWNSDFGNTYSLSQFDNPCTFTGRELDVLDDDSLQIMHYRHRAYDTYAGRFLQQDPLNVSYTLINIKVHISNGLNIYEYCNSEPVNHYDPTGLLTQSCCKAALPGMLSHPQVKPMYDSAKKAKDIDGTPCLEKVECGKCPDKNWGGYYSYNERVVRICTGNPSNSPGLNLPQTRLVLIHEFTHAIQCGNSRNCGHCMRKEIEAYYTVGLCTTEADCVTAAWGSCDFKTFCAGKTASQYIGRFPFPPEPSNPPR